jgi:hypothetical protein
LAPASAWAWAVACSTFSAGGAEAEGANFSRLASDSCAKWCELVDGSLVGRGELVDLEHGVCVLEIWGWAAGYAALQQRLF